MIVPFLLNQLPLNQGPLLFGTAALALRPVPVQPGNAVPISVDVYGGSSKTSVVSLDSYGSPHKTRPVAQDVYGGPSKTRRVS